MPSFFSEWTQEDPRKTNNIKWLCQDLSNLVFGGNYLNCITCFCFRVDHGIYNNTSTRKFGNSLTQTAELGKNVAKSSTMNHDYHPRLPSLRNANILTSEYQHRNFHAVSSINSIINQLPGGTPAISAWKQIITRMWTHQSDLWYKWLAKCPCQLEYWISSYMQQIEYIYI